MAQTPKNPRREAQPSLRDRANALRARVPHAEPDSVLAVISDGRRLLDACRKARRLPGTIEGKRPAAENEATDDLLEHLRETIPQTTPDTPVGAVALAKYAIEVRTLMGTFDTSEEMVSVLKLIAEVRLT